MLEILEILDSLEFLELLEVLEVPEVLEFLEILEILESLTLGNLVGELRVESSRVDSLQLYQDDPLDCKYLIIKTK